MDKSTWQKLKNEQKLRAQIENCKVTAIAYHLLRLTEGIFSCWYQLLSTVHSSIYCKICYSFRSTKVNRLNLNLLHGGLSLTLSVFG